MPLLEVKNLSVSYKKINVLKDINIEVDEGEIVALVGPNGAGKTTLLNSIMGLVKVEDGDIKFNKVSIKNKQPFEIARLGLALVPQERELFSAMTVQENLELGALFIPEAEEHIEDSFELVFKLFPRLKERLGQKAGTLSGGEQRMLAIARALMSHPKLLMLDEPSLGLQPSLVSELFSILKKLNELGITILIVEQYVHNCFKLASKGYVLENGKILLEGQTQELLYNPLVKKAYLGT